MHILDGKSLAAEIRTEVQQLIEQERLTPHLGVILVGSDPASHLYVNLKQKHAAEVGIQVTVRTFHATASDDDILEQIQAWNNDDNVHAILVQLPLPSGHDEQRVIQAIDPAKDVDGFHPTNIESLKQGQFTVLSPLIEGCLRLIAQSPLRLNACKAVIIANSDIFSAPFEQLLQHAGAIVSVMSPDNLIRHTLAAADLIIIAIGRAHFLHSSMTKDDVVIIDIGTNREGDSTVGDVETSSFQSTEAWITPVPGGVGPMTIAQLLKNTTKLALRQIKSKT